MTEELLNFYARVKFNSITRNTVSELMATFRQKKMSIWSTEPGK